MDEATILRNADRLEDDIIALDRARVVCYERGANVVGNRIGKLAVEWREQVREMRQYAKRTAGVGNR